MLNQKLLNELVDDCLEAFFGAINIEESMPPGFSAADIETPEEYINQETEIMEVDDAEQLLGKDDPGVASADMEPMLQKKKEMGGKADHETPYIHRSAFTVIDDNGKEIDLDKLQKTISQRPVEILKQNVKIQKSSGKAFAFFNLTLPAYKGLWFDEKAKEFKIVTTCPSAGDCKLICYARKGNYVQFKVAFISSARVLNFLLNDWQGFKRQLTSEIKTAHGLYKKQGVTVVIRWHDSGDFFNEKYLQIALDIAKETPEVIHYAYTKSIGMVSKADKPKNFVFNYSIGGLQDKDIAPEHKKSIVVPKQYFKDLFPQKGPHLQLEKPITPEMLAILRDRLSKAYNIPAENIITYKQLLDIPYNPNDPNIEAKWHVLVKKGDGDRSASQRNVLTTMLFIH